MRLTSLGHAAFALTMILLGIVGLYARDFAPVWGPPPDGLPAPLFFASLTSIVSLACGVGLLFRRTAPVAAAVLLAGLILLEFGFRVPDMASSALVVGAWFGVVETGVALAAAWVLFARLWPEPKPRWLAFVTGDRGVRIARAIYGPALVFFGLAHFVYLDKTTVLIPHWIPGPSDFWAHLTGAAFMAAGVAVLTGIYARLGAALVALQIGLFTLIVWVPVIVAGSKSPFDWSELIVSTAMSTAAWVLADSYGGRPWFAMRASGTGG